MEAISKSAMDFENKIIEFLRKMKFNHINGGSTFTIGGIQVDACGVINPT